VSLMHRAQSHLFDQGNRSRINYFELNSKLGVTIASSE